MLQLEADKDSFDTVIALKHEIQAIASINQNDWEVNLTQMLNHNQKIMDVMTTLSSMKFSLKEIKAETNNFLSSNI